uniref:DUF2237 domain-containing protein n=1 Tax=Chlamydomonas leiostraca TaxID=1034604 RepID=A0A7S0RVY6_9CHLO|mmetsp:Transcript_32780/g.83188  ORF Transcript_32780/g.83188 Transcript_32780/m.83188 type:complete len:173 (+) Transcript_32780:47-565(+)
MASALLRPSFKAFTQQAHRVNNRRQLVRAASSAGPKMTGAQEGAAQSSKPHPKNVLGGPLECCCSSPYQTGFYRDGFCRTDMMDAGRHVVCARVTQQFLEYSRSRGNDLMTPNPMFQFPGLKDGDKWCLCAARWGEAYDAGCAPPVYLKATHAKALEFVGLDALKSHALDAE